MRRSRGFTYIEIMTVIAVFGILVALLLPAVQAAREAARRMACSNHLAQIILAVQQYESAHRVYPPGTVNSQGPIRHQAEGYHHNWVSQVLPYLEQEPLWRHIDYDVSVYDAANRPARRAHVEVIRCPSAWGSGFGYSDYAGIHHDLEAPIDVDNNGIFFLNSRIRYDDVVDGVSNTLFVGEKATIPGDLGWMSGTRATLRNFGALNGLKRRRAWAVGYPPGADGPGALPANRLAGEELLDELFPAETSSAWGSPSEQFDEKHPRPEDANLAVGGVSSNHPGGAQFALGDGSVRFLAETISLVARRQLANRADRSLADESYW